MTSHFRALFVLALAACGPAVVPPAGGPVPDGPTTPPARGTPAPPVDPAPPPVNPGPPPETYEATGAEGDLEVRRLGVWSQSTYQTRERQVIRDAESLARVWAALGSEEQPRVDFATDIVVLVAAGQRPSGGHGIAVRRAALENGQLLLEVLETRPGAQCVATMALTQPVEVVAVRAARAEGWKFVERADTRDC
jgi:PrcB C-terminal